MNPRFAAIEEIGNRRQMIPDISKLRSKSHEFGSHVFGLEVMRAMLPKEIYTNILNAFEGKEKIKTVYADPIAIAMKDWATSYGATHYCHWFQPMTGASAEKHDAFLEWESPGQIIEKFTGKQLLQGEPDASSFPSGGLRSTYEARGYTGWDPSSFPFLWTAGDGITLCIPSVFFSWTGDVLDNKIPLLRSEKKIGEAAMRLVRFAGLQASSVHSYVGLEQEYFVVDRAFRNLRPDLLLAGRTVFGASAPKGQELQDHYFGCVKDRLLNFMQDFENAALKLGIPLKTRHNEVAPCQHEAAPIFERAPKAIDHNILLMELMRQIAIKHDLSCLLHEKPFKGINGSGKHCNWSLSTDSGINLLDPTESTGNRIYFLVLLTAILDAVHKHSKLLRAAIGSATNDYRLGGHEAPPAIISVYLGSELETLLNSIENGFNGTESSVKRIYDFGLATNPDYVKDSTDRNRTSPLAFTGNKFEFRALGSSANPAFTVTVLNTIIAESLNHIMNEIETAVEHQSPISETDKLEKALSVLRRFIISSKPIRFAGDNYSKDWVLEAKRRELPTEVNSINTFDALKAESTIQAFQGVLTKLELESRFDIMAEHYAHINIIEAKLMLDMFRTQILPAALHYQKELASTITQLKDLEGSLSVREQLSILKEINLLIEEGIACSEDLRQKLEQTAAVRFPYARGIMCREKLAPVCERLREIGDKLETLVEDRLWPLPKYREILFLV